ncbi:MAG TPA: hypothetical protein PLL78_05980 [Fimbriimonadaceae bacterium]|nr:hypothetical protein [Fimbriimonadaceae bacterium]HRJ96216.1 hypothetical protein [Fimbriimonadaceae bacterium]
MISKLIASVAILAACAPALPSAAQEKASLVHKYAKGAKDSYRITAKLDQGGQETEVKVEFQVTILRVTDSGEAEYEFKIEKLEGMGDAEQTTLTGRFDKMGLPKDIESEGVGPILAIFSLASCLPGGELEVGKEFKIDWKAASGGATITGKSAFTALKTGEKAVADLEHTAVLEDGPTTTVKLAIKSKVDVASGLLSSATGSADVGEMQATFKIERLTASK